MWIKRVLDMFWKQRIAASIDKEGAQCFQFNGSFGLDFWSIRSKVNFFLSYGRGSDT